MFIDWAKIMTSNSKIYSQKHRPDEFIATSKRFLGRRRRLGPHRWWRRRRWRRGEPLCLLLLPSLLHLRCLQQYEQINDQIRNPQKSTAWSQKKKFRNRFHKFSKQKKLSVSNEKYPDLHVEERVRWGDLFGACWCRALDLHLHSLLQLWVARLHHERLLYVFKVQNWCDPVTVNFHFIP